MSESNTEVKHYTKKATELRNEGRIEEALLAARKAVSIDAEDANAWWQLALCQEKKEGLAASIKALEKTVEFAPNFAAGWCQLGYAYKKSSMLEEAIESYERALDEDATHTVTLKFLETALKERDFAQDKNRRIEILSILQDQGELDENNGFAYAYLLGERKDYLAAARAYEHHTKMFDDYVAYNNLGVSYQRIGRDLDSIDAYRRSLYLRPDYELAKKNIGLRLPSLLNLKEKVSKKNPYLDQGYWNKHYINPFELLGVDDPSDVIDDPKSLQKYKKALFREIELEEGKVEWMPGLVIDKSTAMTICEQLSDQNQFEYHLAIFENKALCNFLSKGHLDHFLVEEDEPDEPVTLPHELDSDLLAWLGGRFSEQYNLVFSKAIENGDLEVIECLLDGRRWVLPEQEDRCFEGARRAIERLVAPLQKLASSAENEIKVRLSDVQGALKKGKLDQILHLLPAEFTDTHFLVYASLRSISINIYTSQSDAEVAKSVIELGRFAVEKSPVIAHQFEEDQKVLGEKIQEEKAKEAHLTFGNKSLGITKAGVSYDGKKISSGDIVAARWGIVFTSNSPRTARFSIAFKDKFNTEIKISWSSTEIDDQKKLWGGLVDATLHYLLDNLIINFKKRLDDGQQTFVGPLSVTSSGVEFEIDGWFSKKKVFCPWGRLSTDIENGSLIVKDPSERKARVDLPLETVDNALVLHFLASKKI